MMEGKVGLETLPLEILAHIAMFLDIKDIVACCGTSSLMRHAFGDNVVWKSKCDIQLVNYLKQTTPLIEPTLERSEVTDNAIITLSPLSEWRKYYTMYVRLIHNWREGRYEQKEIVTRPGDNIYDANFYINDHLFVRKTFFTGPAKEEAHDVWDVQEKYILHSTFGLNFKDYSVNADEARINVYSIVNDKLIIAKSNVVLVYEVSLPKFSRIPLAYAFVFNEPEKRSPERMQQSTTSPLSYEIETALINNIFIGVLTNIDGVVTPILHIWDIETGNKIKEEVVPPVQSPGNICDIKFVSSNNESDVIIKLSNDGELRHCFYYFGYDLLKMKYSSFSVKDSNFNFLNLFGTCVVGIEKNLLVTYCYKTSERLATREFHYHIFREELAIVDGKLLLNCNHIEIMFVLDILNLNIISTVKLGFVILNIKPIFNKFVILNTGDEGEVWEIGLSAKKLFKLHYNREIVAVNAARTKVAVVRGQKIIILNFW